MIAHDKAHDKAHDNQSEPTAPALLSQKVTRTYFEGVWTLTVQGDLDEGDKEAFRDALFQSIESDEADNTLGTNPARDVVLDLNGVTFLSEGVLALLVHAFKLQKARGVAVRLARPSTAVRKKLARMGLTPFFPLDERFFPL